MWCWNLLYRHTIYKYLRYLFWIIYKKKVAITFIKQVLWLYDTVVKGDDKDKLMSIIVYWYESLQSIPSLFKSWKLLSIGQIKIKRLTFFENAVLFWHLHKNFMNCQS